MAIAHAALKTLVEDGMIENSHNMGIILNKRLQAILGSPVVKETRGRGLMQCIEISADSKVDGHDFCKILFGNGLITKATQNYVCRLTPPLVINEDELHAACDIIETSIKQLEKLNESRY
jgi:ornithine--oxo-acid transaminase